jgi:NAD(P)-dependent dehydrogenase (short-subunit alcohol dehydrogenase family)
MTDRELQDRVALVTGAGGSGIGSAIVEELARRGAAILALDRSPADLDRQIEGWNAEGLRCWGATADVSDRQDVVDALDALCAHVGPPSIVVNSAAVGSLSPLPDLTPEDWSRLMAVNVAGAANVIQATLPMLERGGGAIVNVSSLAAHFPPAQAPAYAASKAALESLTRSIAIDYGPSGVRCNAVAPGPVRTPYVERHRDAMAREIEAIPLGRLAETNEVADAVCFLASDRASYISGHVLVLSGGRPA